MKTICAFLLLLSSVTHAETYSEIIDAVGAEAVKQGFPIHTALAIAAAGSGLNPQWVEPGSGTRGAGLFQLTEPTASKINGGTAVSKQQLLDLKTSVALALKHMGALYKQLGNSDKVIIAWWAGVNYFKKADNFREQDGAVVPLKGRNTRAWFKAVKAAEASWYAMFQVQTEPK